MAASSMAWNIVTPRRVVAIHPDLCSEKPRVVKVAQQVGVLV